MQKTLEFIIILIIFYGMYEAFNNIAPTLFDNPSQLWIIISALLASTLLLMLYAFTIQRSSARRYKETIAHLEKDISKKDKELKDAFKFKKDLETAAEVSIIDEATPDTITKEQK